MWFLFISPRFIHVVLLDGVYLEDFPVGAYSQHMLKSEWTFIRVKLGGLSGLGKLDISYVS